MKNQEENTLYFPYLSITVGKKKKKEAKNIFQISEYARVIGKVSETILNTI